MKYYVDQDKSKYKKKAKGKEIKRNLKEKNQGSKTFLKILYSKTKHEHQVLFLLTVYG